LQVDDQIQVMGNLSLADYSRDVTKVPLEGYSPGQVVIITVLRNGNAKHIPWVMPIPTLVERLSRAATSLFYLPFWLAGMIVLFSLRPRDRHWLLLILVNNITAVWLAAGMIWSYHVAGTALVAHALSWLIAPLYLDLHLSICNLGKPWIQRRILLPVYIIASILAVLEFSQRLPVDGSWLGLVLAFFLSFGLLGYGLSDSSPTANRPANRLILAGFIVSFGPGMV
jgi:hypothetical protein